MTKVKQYIRKFKPYYPEFNIQAIGKRYKAKHVGDFCIRTKTGSYTDSPVMVFYTKDAHPDGSNYIGFYYGYDKTTNEFDVPMICNAVSAFLEPIDAVIADDGEIIYSRFRHDYVTSEDGSVWIDGGRDYRRCGVYKPNRYVQLGIKKHKLIVL